MLSRLPHQKILLFSIFFFCFIGLGLIQTKTVSAQACPAGWCSMIQGCQPVVGCAQPGAVFNCTLGGWKECLNGQWVVTDKRTPTPDLYQINPWGDSSLERFQESLVECGETGEISLECFTGGAEQMKAGAASGTIPNILNGLSTAIIGPVNPEYAQTAPQGAIQTVNHLIAGMYDHPPASSGEYLADLGRSLGIIPKPAYAQGIGFIGLNPVLNLWKIFRNIAYLFFVIVFVFVGFAIMFRVKIDPQTVISIQSALPKLVIALLLVTFSYAIAGFLIDLIYVFISLIFALLNPEGVSLDVHQNIFAIAGQIFGGIGGLRAATNLGTQLNILVQDIFAGLGGQILGFTISALATAVFAIAIAFALFKLFFSLLMSYISIIVGVIFSPLILLLEAIPGQKGFGAWLKMMLSNIIVFPITAGILAIALLLTQGAQNNQGQIWVAPFLGAETTGAYVPTLIGIGMLLLAGSIIDQVKKAMGGPGIAGLAGGIMAPLGAAGGVMMAGPRALWGETGGAMFEEARKVRGTQMAGALPKWFRGEKPPTGGRT